MGLSSKKDSLDNVLQDLEFNLVSINEARLSTSMSKSMKRLRWITFLFLPLTFISGLFGMNVNLLASNPSWWFYMIFASTTMFITFTVWIVFKRYPVLELAIEDRFAWLVKPGWRFWGDLEARARRS